MAVLLGVVQGVTEFLPVSSSGHLLLAQRFLGVDASTFGLAYDAALHLGTLLAVVAFFSSDLARLWRGFVRSLPRPDLGQPDQRLAYLIAVATVPAALIGFSLEEVFATRMRSPWVVVAALFAVGALFIAAEQLGKRTRPAADLRFSGAAGIGLAQAFALIPGVSRSGATITLGLFLGLTRGEAARFSFLMSVPIIAGAGGWQALQAVQSGIGLREGLLFGAGVLSSAVVGYLAIRFFLSYVAHHSLTVFAGYRFALGAVVAVALLTGSL